MAMKGKIGKVVAGAGKVATGALLLAALSSIPVLAHGRDKNKLEKTGLHQNGMELIAENKGDIETPEIDGEKIPMFFMDGKKCYAFDKGDGKFALFEREDGKIVGGFYRQINGKTQIEPVDIWDALESSGYKTGDPVGVHALDEGEKYVLFPEGASRALIVWEKAQYGLNDIANKSAQSIAVIPANNKEGDYISSNYKEIFVEDAGDGNSGSMYVAGNFLFVVPKEGYSETLITRLDIIVEMEKKLGNVVSDLSDFDIEPYGDTAGSEFNIDAKWIYALRVTKPDDPSFERIYAVSFGKKVAKFVGFAMGE